MTDISSCCTRSPAYLNRAAANKYLEAVPGASGSRLAGEPCSVPHQLLHISEAGWGGLCLSHHRSTTQFLNNLCFRLQLVLLVSFPRLLETEKMGLHTYTPKDHFTQTVQKKRLSPATASVTFRSIWCALLSLCSIVIPSELAKGFSMDFQVLDLTATPQSLVIAVSLLPLSNWHKVCTASILTTRSFNSET